MTNETQSSFSEDGDSSQCRRRVLNPYINSKKSMSQHDRTSKASTSKDIVTLSSKYVSDTNKEMLAHLKLKRSAYKEVTSLKTWPLQAPAVTALETLTREYLAQAPNHEKSEGHHHQEMKLGRNDSDDEEHLSPRKVSLRSQFISQFQEEHAIPKGVKDETCFDETLWSMEPRIFAIEKSAAGKRKYLVGHMGRFMDFYWRKIDPKQRHYYELIREKTPCRLYFDLEFSRESNPDILEEDSEVLIEEFIEELGKELERMYDLTIDRSSVIDLDSSTTKKFSRHLIVHLPNNALFADNIVAGRFVKVLVGRLAGEVATGQLEDTKPMLAKHLFVNSPPSKKQDASTASSNITAVLAKSCFIDLGVYTRNRLFRILGASKFGKPPSAALRIAQSNKFRFPEGFSNDKFYVPSISEKSETTTFMAAFDWSAHAEVLSSTFVVPSNVLKLDVPILEDSCEAKEFAEVGKSVLPSINPIDTSTSKRSTAVKMGKSQFAILDDYVYKSLASRGGIQGVIRGWSILYDGELPQSITYQLTRNRYCEAIGRHHKSNQIMWTVDFVSMTSSQKCWDPECRATGFRGERIPLPQDVEEKVGEVLFDFELAAMDLSPRNSVACLKDKSNEKAEEAEPAVISENDNDEDTEEKIEYNIERAFEAMTMKVPGEDVNKGNSSERGDSSND